MKVFKNAVLALALCLTACAQQPPLIIVPLPAQEEQAMPDRFCSKTEATQDDRGKAVPPYYLFLGPDGEIGLSPVSCTAAVVDWSHRFTAYPRQYKL